MTTRDPTSLWNPPVARGGLLALAGLLACTPSIEDYAGELEEAFCAWEHACHKYERTRDCVDARDIERDPQYAYLVRAVGSGSVAYDRDAAAECLDAIRERSCDNAGDEAPEVCERVFVGTVGRNAPCLSSAECAGNAVCGFDPTCSEQCCVGACRVFADPLAIGEACSFSGTDCVPAAYCAQDPMTGLTTVCTARVKAGGDCSLGQRCVDDSQCDGNKCRAVKEVGVGEACDGGFAVCAEPAYCDFNGGQARCKLEPTLGEPCVPGQDSCRRVDTYCDDASALCTLLPGPGQACVEYGRCADYASCEPLGSARRPDGAIGEAPTCVRLPTEGEACDYQCLGDLDCIDGRCSFRELEPAPLCELPGG